MQRNRRPSSQRRSTGKQPITRLTSQTSRITMFARVRYWCGAGCTGVSGARGYHDDRVANVLAILVAARVLAEGMGYGMMIMVQLDHQPEFDRWVLAAALRGVRGSCKWRSLHCPFSICSRECSIWAWVRAHMYHGSYSDPLYGELCAACTGCIRQPVSATGH